jgi:hypothetical protein
VIWYEISSGDGINVQFSTDLGINWTPIGTQGDNWYTDSSISSLSGPGEKSKTQLKKEIISQTNPSSLKLIQDGLDLLVNTLLSITFYSPLNPMSDSDSISLLMDLPTEKELLLMTLLSKLSQST